MPFTGFDVKLPEYEVITPQTKLSFNVKSLTVQEEERLKGSFVTPSKITDHLNKCIYDSITEKPEEIKDFNSFLRSITLKDRDCLLYGLFHITYEDIRNYEIKCGHCQKEYPVTIKAADTFNFNAYPGDNILNQKIKVPLPITKGVTVILKQPSLFDESSALKELSNRPGLNIELIIETLIIEKFEQDIVESKEPKIYSDRVDIIDAYLSLPARDKRIIHKQYLDNFGKYGIELKMKSFCPTCGEEEEVNIDLVENFFRNVYES